MARPKLGKGDSQRLQMVISDEELQAIEEWRFRNRIQSKSEAIRRLAQMSLRIDEPIEKIYRRSKELYSVLLSRHDVTTFLLSEDVVDWERIAKIDLVTTTELIKHVSELQMAAHAMTAQVMKMRAAGEIPDLRAEAEQIKVEAAQRTKMFRMLMKASEAGISPDDEEDEP